MEVWRSERELRIAWERRPSTAALELEVTEFEEGVIWERTACGSAPSRSTTGRSSRRSASCSRPRRLPGRVLGRHHGVRQAGRRSAKDVGSAGARMLHPPGDARPARRAQRAGPGERRRLPHALLRGRQGRAAGPARACLLLNHFVPVDVRSRRAAARGLRGFRRPGGDRRGPAHGRRAAPGDRLSRAAPRPRRSAQADMVAGSRRSEARLPSAAISAQQQHDEAERRRQADQLGEAADRGRPDQEAEVADRAHGGDRGAGGRSGVRAAADSTTGKTQERPAPTRPKPITATSGWPISRVRPSPNAASAPPARTTAIAAEPGDQAIAGEAAGRHHQREGGEGRGRHGRAGAEARAQIDRAPVGDRALATSSAASATMPGTQKRERRAARSPGPSAPASAAPAASADTRSRRPRGSERRSRQNAATMATSSAASRPVTPAPAMPPRLNMPCSDDMIGASRRFSTATPCAFIETSSAPPAAPATSRRQAEPDQARGEREAGQAEREPARRVTAVAARLP